jgi:tetratricopeptide (TPR) repeat protein
MKPVVRPNALSAPSSRRTGLLGAPRLGPPGPASGRYRGFELVPIAAAALALLLLATPSAKSHESASSTTIIGTTNVLLSQGAEELQNGHVDEGLRLTLEGLKEPGDVHDIAAGHANACAAYALQMNWDEALEHCNQALALDNSNWRAFNNRAAIYVAKGLFELAFQDINSGLEIAPNSSTLHESLRVAQRNKRIMERLGRHAVPS